MAPAPSDNAVLPTVPDRGPAILTTMWSFTILSTIFVVARVYTRAVIVRQHGIGEWIIILSGALSLAYIVIITEAVNIGVGKHISDLSPAQIDRALYLNAAAFAPGMLSFCIPKFAVVVLLIKLLNPNKITRICLWGTTIGVTVMAVGGVLVYYLHCDQSTYKMELVNYMIVLSVVSALTDLFLAFYPARVIWQLQMEFRKKIRLTLAMGLGSSACWVTAYKSTRLSSMAKGDLTYMACELLISTSLESNVLIIAACIPTLKPLIEPVFFRYDSRASTRTAQFSGWIGWHQTPIKPYKPPKALTKDKICSNSLAQVPILSQQHDDSRSYRRSESPPTLPSLEMGRVSALGGIRRTDEIVIQIEQEPMEIVFHAQ